MDNLDELGCTTRYNTMATHRENHTLRLANGMTIIGMLFTVFIVVYIGITIMKIMPVYIQNYTIEQSVVGLEQLKDSSLTDDGFANIEVIKSALMRRFEINGINDIKEKQIIITPTNNDIYNIKIDYSVVRHLFANIDFLFEFSINKQVKINGSR